MLRAVLIGWVLLTLASVPAVAQTVTTGQPVIFDANDQVVGPVVDYVMSQFGDSFKTALFVDDEPVFLLLPEQDRSVLIHDILDGFEAAVQYESSDCTGQPYLIGSSTTNSFLSIPVFATNVPELTLWIAASPNLVTGLTFNSGLTIEGNCLTGVPSATSGFPASAVPTSFVGPYRLGRASSALATPLAVPAVSPTGLVVLAAFLLGAGWWLLRR